MKVLMTVFMIGGVATFVGVAIALTALVASEVYRGAVKERVRNDSAYYRAYWDAGGPWREDNWPNPWTWKEPYPGWSRDRNRALFPHAFGGTIQRKPTAGPRASSAAAPTAEGGPR